MERRTNIFRRMSRPQGSTRLSDATERIEQAGALDRPIRALTTAVRRTLRPGPVRDALHGVPVGHPAHPPLTDVPMGCWMSAALLDLVPGTRRASQTLDASRRPARNNDAAPRPRRSAREAAETTVECRGHCARIVVSAFHRCVE